MVIHYQQFGLHSSAHVMNFQFSQTNLILTKLSKYDPRRVFMMLNQQFEYLFHRMDKLAPRPEYPAFENLNSEGNSRG
jgi:hypothetical protein